MNTDRKIVEIESRLGYSFDDREIIKNALVHSSYINENKSKNLDNERLEFLGDSVLSLVISEHLYNTYPNKTEGELTKARAKLVCETTLSMCARNIDIGSMLVLGKGEENSGGRDRSSTLADAFEAVIAAVYLDGGFINARKFVLKMLSKYIEDAVSGRIIHDYKTYYQEIVQANKDNVLKYVLAKTKGPDHSKTFYVDVLLNGSIQAGGVGRSKKDAEQDAARSALIKCGCFDDRGE